MMIGVYVTTAPGANKDESRNPTDFVEARIDIRKFSQFLAGHQHSPVKILCSKLKCTLNYAVSI